MRKPTRYLAALPIALLGALLLANPASAQSSDPFADAARDAEPEARLSLRIPFGSGERNAAGSPQLDLSLRREVWNRHSTIGLPRYSETRLGFTLHGDTALLLNGQPLASDAPAMGQSTGRTVVDGFAIVGIITVTTAAVLVAASEIS